ncbi:hypothetical protein HBI25_231350 [Parastagonospora nodorum]|nr:hypothetical protein HBI25_231350 [Parastagonospora nodorum]
MAIFKNKFGFRPLRAKPASRVVKPQAPRPKGRSVASPGQTRAKRAKSATSNLGATPLIEISDDEDSDDENDDENDDEDGGNDGDDEDGGNRNHHSRHILGNSSTSHIVDLTIQSPPSDSSPELPTRSIADQKKAEAPIMLQAEEPVILQAEETGQPERAAMVDSEVQYQFSFSRSRSDAFAEVIKTEVEEQSPIAQRFRSLTLEREETPMERLMPRNVITPIRTTHFDDLLHRMSEKKRLGVQQKARIFTQKIGIFAVQEARLELFWITTMKLVDTRQRFVRNHDRLSLLLGAVNKELGRQGKEPFSWDEGHDIAKELQNQRKLTLTSGTNPKLFFTRDGQEVMGVQPR